MAWRCTRGRPSRARVTVSRSRTRSSPGGLQGPPGRGRRALRSRGPGHPGGRRDRGTPLVQAGLMLPAAQEVDGPVARDAQEPAGEAPPDGVEAGHLVPAAEEGVLEHLLRQVPVTHDAQGHGVDEAGVAVVEGGQGRLVPLPDAVQEEGLVEGFPTRGWPWRGPAQARQDLRRCAPPLPSRGFAATSQHLLAPLSCRRPSRMRRRHRHRLCHRHRRRRSGGYTPASDPEPGLAASPTPHTDRR